MKTEMMAVDAASLARAASLLRAGELVAFPTETVYGLGADARNAGAVAKIFAAKERPANNPLIAHIADTDMLDGIVAAVEDQATRLMKAFWPGPLTLVLPHRKRIPEIVSAGLDTLAVRMPSHPAALALIREAGCPIAAPSANRSGRPSPTTADHVLADMDGRIPLILDGGPCGYGVESTVVDVTGAAPTVLRPGGITLEMLREVIPSTRIDSAVLQPLADGAQARSPGMLHRHYAPDAPIIIVEGEPHAVQARIRALYDQAAGAGERVAILCSASSASAYGERFTRVLGQDAADMAMHLYDALRALDLAGATLILSEASEAEGMGLALMNRLLRAADFHVVKA